MKTKKIIYSLLVLSLILMFNNSCEDFLTEEPRGRSATETYFSSKVDLDASINALYKVIIDGTRANNRIGTNFLVGDDISTHPASNKNPLREHDVFAVNDNNAWMHTLWSGRFSIIKAANFIINNAGRTPDATQSEINFTMGQAHYWRAFNYFYLVTTWGKVPVMTQEEINYEAQLSSEEEIYSLIIDDLKKAEEYCPVEHTRSPYLLNGINVAVTKPAVQATLSYVYMTMAGWPLNKGTEYYQLAATKALEVINGVENGTYKYNLLDEYWKIHSIEYNFKNTETILGIYFNRDDIGTQSGLCDFLQDMQQGGWGDTNGEIKFWKEFPEGQRKVASYFPKIMLTDEELYDWWYDTEPASRAVVAPVFMKTQESPIRGEEFDYTSKGTSLSVGEKHHQVIRLSQVYCWYAEAVGRSGQINAKAVEVLNKVRNRADGSDTNIYTMSMTPDELAEAGYDEHGWEIAGYYWGGFANRARDMFRMYRYKDHFEYRKENPLIEVAPGIFRNEKVPVTGTWSDDKMYIPYPFQETVLNPNLTK